jgi:AP-3 complex subunit sigma
VFQTEHAQQQILTDVYQHVSRRAAHLCNFVEFEGCMDWGVGSKIVYKNFATLYFIFVVDSGESELGVLEMIQIFVETLDKCFAEVCELDLVFAWDRTHQILDEIITGGLVSETNTHEVLIALKDQKVLENK